MKQLATELFFLGGKQDSRNANRGLLNVPGRRDVLERDFKISALARSKWRLLRRKRRAGFAQNHLAKLVGEFYSEFDVGKRQATRIGEAPPKSGDFLIQKILSAAERQAINFDFRRVGLFRRAKGKVRFAGERTGRPLRTGPHDDHQRDGDRGGSHPGNPQAATIWLRLSGALARQGVRHAIDSANDADADAARRQGCAQNDGLRLARA